LVLLGAAPCLAGTIAINGICQTGNCGSPDTVSLGGSTTLSVSTVFTLPNTDRYLVTFDAAPSETPGLTTLDIQNWSATYLGNQSSTASAADQINLDAAQDFQTPIEGVGVQFTLTGFFLGPIVDGSTVTSTILINGSAITSAGPATSPGSFSLASPSVPYTTTTDTTLERIFTFNFAPGSGPGAQISRTDIASIPEPGSILLFLGGAAAFASRKKIR
jgi:hypothetical protein